MKANFKLSKNNSEPDITDVQSKDNSHITAREFEEFVIKSGARGSFMIFRSNKKEDELGIDEL